MFLSFDIKDNLKLQKVPTSVNINAHTPWATVFIGRTTFPIA